MSDAKKYWVHPWESDAPEQIWIWGWQADSSWQSQTWQHEDEPISTMKYIRADRIEALTKERNALRSALNRIRPIPERILRGIPVRDLAETLAEADSALIKGESHE
jgi:hypothetical protein